MVMENFSITMDRKNCKEQNNCKPYLCHVFAGYKLTLKRKCALNNCPQLFT